MSIYYLDKSRDDNRIKNEFYLVQNQRPMQKLLKNNKKFDILLGK